MPDKGVEKSVYAQTVLDFVTVSVEFCAFLENNETSSRLDWINRMTRLLPLMYIKASLLPETVIVSDDIPEVFVSEDDYARVSTNVSQIMADEDVYLDVFVEDMKYSDTPITSFISEDIADIYQDVRNFVSIYQYGLTDQMNDALYRCTINFRNYWGQKLVNVLRPLHALLYREQDEEDMDGIKMEEKWD